MPTDTILSALDRKLAEIKRRRNPVIRAQHSLLAIRVAIDMAHEESQAAEKAHPVKAFLDEMSAKCDAIEPVKGDVDAWDIATSAIIAEMKPASDELYEACKGFYAVENTLRSMRIEAEKALLRACLEHMPFSRPPGVSDLLQQGIDGKLYYGIPSMLGPMDKLLDLCLRWNGRGPK